MLKRCSGAGSDHDKGQEDPSVKLLWCPEAFLAMPIIGDRSSLDYEPFI